MLNELGDSLAIGAAAAVSSGLIDLGTSNTATSSVSRPKPAQADSQRVILIALAGYSALITLLCLFLLIMLARLARRAVGEPARNCNRSVATAWPSIR